MISIRRDVCKDKMMTETSDRKAVSTGVACLFHKKKGVGLCNYSVGRLFPPPPPLIKFQCILICFVWRVFYKGNLTHRLRLEAICLRGISCQDEYSCYSNWDIDSSLFSFSPNLLQCLAGRIQRCDVRWNETEKLPAARLELRRFKGVNWRCRCRYKGATQYKCTAR